ncbi:MAG: hypothetical protein AAFV53_21875 [Myxococcota bacterium]
MSDRERRQVEQLRDENIHFAFAAAWWLATLSVPIGLAVRYALATGPYRDLAAIPMRLAYLLPIFLGIPAGIALMVHTRTLHERVRPQDFPSLERRANALMAWGIALTALTPLLSEMIP